MTTVHLPHFRSRKTTPLTRHLLLLLLLLIGSGGALGGAGGRRRAEGRTRTGSGGGSRSSGHRRAHAGAGKETGLEDADAFRSAAGEGVGGGEARAWAETDTAADTVGGSMTAVGGGLWEPPSSSRCVPIPPSMALCRGIGYDTMRTPNLLAHESPGEAVQQSASWLPLLARECHSDARFFLCSLFAPICLDRFVFPCRSLCESVRDSCAPIMACYGYPWPSILRCDQFPADHLMCISSITNTSVEAGGRRVPQASCRDCELEVASSAKDTLDTFCRNDFVVKLRLIRLKFSATSLAQFSLGSKLEVLKHGPLLGGQIRSRVQQWLERDATCVGNMSRHQSGGGTFLVTGTVHGERLVVTKAFAWLKRHKNLVAAVRKWKRHQCKS
ncbi:secreted frizzled-related protein 5 [Gadus macrocephalus]|uniref:secreted frizzled-related protein 5 n=1 Tax=Gadus macrocephalus TaxID=80720 RepID=UPI0028CB5C6B|nr:secreted frizzled-related protein 5 [Gadus macrocephalus]